MSGPRARLLVSGDFHLGRTPTRVPPADRALSVEAVVRALVGQAIERDVDAVVLTGDVADESNKYFEASGVLERTLRRLADAGIPVFAVAGNHDYDVLGSVVDALGAAGVRVLGRGQQWEATSLERDGREVLRLVGWSFAGPHVHESPLTTFPEAEPGVPVVGLLHADLDQPTSPYAPVALADLWATGASAWLLGHVHAPQAREQDGRIVLYPGSPQPLDPGEPGAHGPWIVEVDDAGRTSAVQLPLSTVRYDALGVDLDEAADAAEVRERVVAAVRLHAEAVRADAPALRRLVVRLRLTGRTPAFRAVEGVAAELRDGGDLAAGGLDVTVDRVEDASRPSLDLDRLAAGSGPVATLAGLALRLDAGELSAGDLALVRRGVEALQAARRARVFEPLRQDGRLDDDLEAEAVRRLRQQTFRLLDEALDQRPSDAAVLDVSASIDPEPSPAASSEGRDPTEMVVESPEPAPPPAADPVS